MGLIRIFGDMDVPVSSLAVEQADFAFITTLADSYARLNQWISEKSPMGVG
jgi:hypothetical protein